MSKSAIKTKPNLVKVDDYIESLTFDRQMIAEQLIDIMEDITGEPPVMWGPTMVGFGTYHYSYASGQEADWFRIGFSARKGKTSLYLVDNAEAYVPELEKLEGKYSFGKSCIYLHKFDAINLDALRALIQKAYDDSKRVQP